MAKKPVLTAAEAAKMIPDGATIMCGGFLACGQARAIVKELVKLGTKDLTLIANDMGRAVGPKGEEFFGIAELIHNHQVKRVIATHVGMTPEVGQQNTEGTLEVNLLPQGTLAECIRAGGAGLGGVLTPDEETQADSYASQLMEQNGDLYKANGIGLDTLKRFERILIKSNDLLEMYYGTDGETPVSDAELTSHLEDEMVYIRYVVVPLYNTSTFAFADDDQSAQMLELAQTAAESCNAATPDGASAQTSAFSAAVAAALPDIYAVLDGEPSSDASSLSTALLGSDNIDATFSEEGTADAVRALKPGEAAAVQYSSYALMMLVRLDPLDADTLDSLHAQALSDMKSGELQDSIQSYGAQLSHALDSAAMKKMPASKIKNEQ